MPVGGQSAGGETHSSGAKNTGAATMMQPILKSPVGEPALTAQADDAVNHRFEIRSAVHLAKALPGKPGGKGLEAFEEAEPRYGLVGCPQLEEERLARGDGSEPPVAVRLPEVDLIDSLMLSEKPIPVWISEAYVAATCVHAYPQPAFATALLESYTAIGPCGSRPIGFPQRHQTRSTVSPP